MLGLHGENGPSTWDEAMQDPTVQHKQALFTSGCFPDVVVVTVCFVTQNGRRLSVCCKQLCRTQWHVTNPNNMHNVY